MPGGAVTGSRMHKACCWPLTAAPPYVVNRFYLLAKHGYACRKHTHQNWDSICTWATGGSREVRSRCQVVPWQFWGHDVLAGRQGFESRVGQPQVCFVARYCFQ